MSWAVTCTINHVNRTVALIPLKGLGWLGEKVFPILLPQLLDDGLHLSNQRMDALVTSVTEKPLICMSTGWRWTIWCLLERYLSYGSLIPSRTIPGNRKHLQKKLWKELDHCGSRMVKRQSTALTAFTTLKHEPKDLTAKVRADFLHAIRNPKLIVMLKINWFAFFFFFFFKYPNRSWWKIYCMLYAFWTNLFLKITTDFQTQNIYALPL